MKVKDHRQMMRSLTDPLNIPKLRALIEANPVLTQEEFKARQSYKPGGLVEPGVEYYGKKEIVPPKTHKWGPTEIKKLSKDFIGRFGDAKIYKQNLNDAFEIYNVIKKSKGKIASLEDLGVQVGFLTPGGKPNPKRTKLALDLLRASDFADDIKDFKFLKDLYPKVGDKATDFRNLDMVSDSIINYKGTIGIDRDEALAQFLPENMSKNYRRAAQHGDVKKGVFKEMYHFNKDKIKYITDQVSKATGEKFTVKDYRVAMDEARDIRARARLDRSLQTRLAPINAQIQTLAGDNKIKTLLEGKLDNKTQKAILNRAVEILDIDIGEASRRMFMLGEVYSPKNNRVVAGVNTNADLGNKIIETAGDKTRSFARGQVYAHYAQVIDNALGAGPGKSFIGHYQERLKKGMAQGMRPDEIFSITASGRRGLEPYAVFTQSLKADVNSRIKGAFIDSKLSTTHRDLQEIFKGKKWNQLSSKQQEKALKLVENFEKVKKDALTKPINPAEVKQGKKPIYLTDAEKKVLQLPEFDLKNPPSKSIERWGQYGKGLQKAFNKSYDTVGYSMKVPKEFLTQKEMFTTQQKVQPSAFKELINRTGSGIDPLLAGKAVVEETGNLLKGAAKYKEPLWKAAKKVGAAALSPTGTAGIWYGLGGVDLKDPWDRGGLAAEAVFAPALVKSTEYATKGIKNPLVKQGVQRFLNLGMSLPMATRIARMASPVGWLSLAGEGLYQAGKKEMARREQMSPQELEDFHLEQQSRGWSRMRQATGGRVSYLEGGIVSLLKK